MMSNNGTSPVAVTLKQFIVTDDDIARQNELKRSIQVRLPNCGFHSFKSPLFSLGWTRSPSV